MKYTVLFVLLIMLVSCRKDVEQNLDPKILADYIELNKELALSDLIACAGGKDSGLDGSGMYSTSIFFLPVSGATDFKYFEASNISDSLNFDRYIEKNLTLSPVFNGFLQKFNRPEFSGEKMGIVTFKTSGKLHICVPIRHKTNVKPTEINPDLLQIEPDGVGPTFSWENGIINENVIYFQVISTLDGDLISGTYTYEKNFTFYDLSNVVLNINDVTPAPELEPAKTYHFTMMAVSEDNWVNLLIESDFTTE